MNVSFFLFTLYHPYLIAIDPIYPGDFLQFQEIPNLVLFPWFLTQNISMVFFILGLTSATKPEHSGKPIVTRSKNKSILIKNIDWYNTKSNKMNSEIKLTHKIHILSFCHPLVYFHLSVIEPILNLELLADTAQAITRKNSGIYPNLVCFFSFIYSHA